MKGWVVFSGETELWWLRRILRPGFRHCFVVFHDGQHWISFDPLASHAELCVNSCPPDFDLPFWLEEQGYMVVQAAPHKPQGKIAPLMFYSCVEAVKRLLGIQALHIITPWQLYCHLNKTTT